MSGPDRDEDFESYLARKRPVFARYDEVDPSEPPPEVDRRVLARAREAVAGEASPAPFPRMRWAVPFALAATLVLSFAIVLNIGVPDARPPAPVAAPALEQKREAAQENAAAAYEPASLSGAPAVASEERIDARKLKARVRAQAKAAPPASPEALVDRAAEAPALQSADAAAGPTPAAAEIHTLMESPEDWLARIEKLRAEGRQTEADAEWAAFRKAHPDHAAVAEPQTPSR